MEFCVAPPAMYSTPGLDDSSWRAQEGGERVVVSAERGHVAPGAAVRPRSSGQAPAARAARLRPRARQPPLPAGKRLPGHAAPGTWAGACPPPGSGWRAAAVVVVRGRGGLGEAALCQARLRVRVGRGRGVCGGRQKAEGRLRHAEAPATHEALCMGPAAGARRVAPCCRDAPPAHANPGGRGLVSSPHTCPGRPGRQPLRCPAAGCPCPAGRPRGRSAWLCAPRAGRAWRGARMVRRMGCAGAAAGGDWPAPAGAVAHERHVKCQSCWRSQGQCRAATAQFSRPVRRAARAARCQAGGTRHPGSRSEATTGCDHAIQCARMQSGTSGQRAGPQRCTWWWWRSSAPPRRISR